MTREEARKLLDKHLKDVSLLSNWNIYFKDKEPCLYPVYKEYQDRIRTPDWFLREAEEAIIAAHSPLGKLL